MAAAFNLSRLIPIVVLLLHAVCMTTASSDLPVFFFHAANGKASAGNSIKTNVTGQGRVFNALNICQGTCSVQILRVEVELMVLQIRSIISNDTATYANGYIFVGHGQGGVIARAVIESMDDHNVTTFISLAAPQNGVFYGPQKEDAVALAAFLKLYAPAMIPTSVFNFSSYSTADYRGKLQYDFNQLLAKTPELSTQYSAANLFRSPAQASWIDWNPFLPELNNLDACSNSSCTADQASRKANFLKLKKAYFLGSPRDGVIAPFQSAMLGQYSNVSSADQIKSRFEKLKILPLIKGTEYMNDTYGVRTLFQSGRLTLRRVENVPHECWVRDTRFHDDNARICAWKPIFAEYVYPLLNG